MLNQEQQNNVVALCQKLIQSPSYSGHEDGVVARLKEFFEANGFDSVHVDKYGNALRATVPAPASSLTVTSTPCPWAMLPSGITIPSAPKLQTARFTAAAPPT